MKTNYLFIILVTMVAFYGYNQEFLRDPELGDSYPLQSAVCDVAGIGRLVNRNSTQSCVHVEIPWIGLSTNSIIIEGNENFPTNHPFVFFATRYTSLLNIDPIYARYGLIFNKAMHHQSSQPDGLFTLNEEDSWFLATPENQNLINWCSNLVYTSQIATNRMAFYELIRDGYRLNPPNSRIHSDSYCTFVFFYSFCDTNLILSVWNDTNLIGRARSWVNNSYESLTRSLLPWPTNQLAPQVLE